MNTNELFSKKFFEVSHVREKSTQTQVGTIADGVAGPSIMEIMQFDNKEGSIVPKVNLHNASVVFPQILGTNPSGFQVSPAPCIDGSLLDLINQMTFPDKIKRGTFSPTHPIQYRINRDADPLNKLTPGIPYQMVIKYNGILIKIPQTVKSASQIQSLMLYSQCPLWPMLEYYFGEKYADEMRVFIKSYLLEKDDGTVGDDFPIVYKTTTSTHPSFVPGIVECIRRGKMYKLQMTHTSFYKITYKTNVSPKQSLEGFKEASKGSSFPITTMAELSEYFKLLIVQKNLLKWAGYNPALEGYNPPFQSVLVFHRHESSLETGEHNKLHIVFLIQLTTVTPRPYPKGSALNDPWIAWDISVRKYIDQQVVSQFVIKDKETRDTFLSNGDLVPAGQEYSRIVKSYLVVERVKMKELDPKINMRVYNDKFEFGTGESGDVEVKTSNHLPRIPKVDERLLETIYRQTRDLNELGSESSGSKRILNEGTDSDEDEEETPVPKRVPKKRKRKSPPSKD